MSNRVSADGNLVIELEVRAHAGLLAGSQAKRCRTAYACIAPFDTMQVPLLQWGGHG